MTRARVLYSALGAVLTAAFVTLGVLVNEHPPPVDRAIATALRGVWREPLGQVAAVVTDILGPVLPVVFGTILVLWILLSWWRGQRGRAGLLFRVGVVLLLCRITSPVFKAVFDRARPRPHPDFAYPSGHVVSVLSVGLAAIVLCRWLAPRFVGWLVAVTAVATALSAASRIVLGVHWLTDTIGSVLIVLGVGLPACVALGLLPARRERVSVADTAA